MNISMFTNILSSLNKVVRIGSAARDFQKVGQDQSISDDAKALRQATDIGLIVTGSASLLGNGFNIPHSIKIGLEIGNGGFDVAQRVSVLVCQKEIALDDWVDLGCLITFRACDITKTTLTLRPEVFSGRSEDVIGMVNLAETGVQLVANREALKKSWKLGKKAFQYFCNYCTEREEVSLVIPINPDLGDLLPSELRVDAQTERRFDAVRNAQTIEDFNRIPELFIRDPVLKKFLCPISKKPIRYVASVCDPKNHLHSIYYEKSAIENFMAVNSDQLPPQWPQGLTFTRENIVNDLETQGEIDQHLRLLLENFKETPIVIQRDEVGAKMVLLAKGLGIGNQKISGGEIGDKIIKNIPHFASSTVSVKQLRHLFHSTTAKKPTTKIEIAFYKIFSGNRSISLIDQKKAVCSLLGSTDISEKTIAETVFQRFRKLELYVSHDLQNIAGHFQ